MKGSFKGFKGIKPREKSELGHSCLYSIEHDSAIETRMRNTRREG